ncbi:MAG: tetratricopeptide repeat protein [Bacteroidetes bacterium]|nr:tetratricopeptide repeat protein [Bacteroidota bacterium]
MSNLNFSRFLYKTVLYLLVVFFAGCSPEKNTSSTRVYHNLTSHYNIYFNGEQSFLKGVEKIENSFQNNYSQILSVFNYVDADLASQVKPQMDRAIRKATKVITLHSIKVKPEIDKENLSKQEKEFLEQPEYNIWVDDSYLLMGKAQFYKHDFKAAQYTFKHVIKEALDEDIRIQGDIWLARTFCETDNFNNALKVLTVLAANDTIPDKFVGDVSNTYGDFYLKQRNFEMAVPHLTKALEYARDKKKKTRYSFILAQIQQELGYFENASDLYKKVIKMNPPYEMAFNAKINLAGAYDVSMGNSSEIVKELEKMLKDDKNIDYHDQIYYALGSVSMKEEKIGEAIELYKQSVAGSISNTNQKGLSYLSLADIYFERKDYKLSQAYYDSAVTTLDKSYPGYESIAVKTGNLTRLVDNILIVEREDSLQMVAQMSESEQKLLINNIIQKIKEEERRQRETAESKDQYNLGQFYEDQRRFQKTLDRSGKWYFYNPETLAFGRTEFRKKWGDRKLSDSWRRKNKNVISFDQEAISQEGSDSLTTGKTGIDDKKSVEFYMKDIPSNDSLMMLSHARIAEALYKVGRIYQTDMDNLVKAAEVYEELNSRYPESDDYLSSLYHLYELHLQQSHYEKSNYYKNLIIDKYPDSEYAQFLSDPDFYKKLKEKQDEIKRFYENTYILYKEGKYNSVIDNCDKALTDEKDHELAPKFALLRAMAIGNNADEAAFKEALVELNKTYPQSEEKNRADELIAYLNETYTVLKQEEEKQIAKEIYLIKEDQEHLFVLALESGGTDINRIIFDIINFNLDNFVNTTFKTEGELLDNGLQIISVRSFENKATALEYYRLINSNTDVFKSIERMEYSFFVISLDNFKTFKQNKSASTYLKFFEENYLP